MQDEVVVVFKAERALKERIEESAAGNERTLSQECRYRIRETLDAKPESPR